MTSQKEVLNNLKKLDIAEGDIAVYSSGKPSAMDAQQAERIGRFLAQFGVSLVWIPDGYKIEKLGDDELMRVGLCRIENRDETRARWAERQVKLEKEWEVQLTKMVGGEVAQLMLKQKVPA